jgi:N-methylhydantoinase B/oxoprolinase/acetone carboxylase alpha subunit
MRRGTQFTCFTSTNVQILTAEGLRDRAVTYSAIIYCMRCMVAREIPLNQGECLLKSRCADVLE